MGLMGFWFCCDRVRIVGLIACAFVGTGLGCRLPESYAIITVCGNSGWPIEFGRFSDEGWESTPVVFNECGREHRRCSDGEYLIWHGQFRSETFGVAPIVCDLVISIGPDCFGNHCDRRVTGHFLWSEDPWARVECAGPLEVDNTDPGLLSLQGGILLHEEFYMLHVNDSGTLEVIQIPLAERKRAPRTVNADLRIKLRHGSSEDRAVLESFRLTIDSTGALHVLSVEDVAKPSSANGIDAQ